MTRFFRNIFILGLLLTANVFVSLAQNVVSVSGIVKDSITGETIPYVAILFQGSMTGGTTDDDGRFNLQNNQGYTRLLFSSLGYNSKEVTLRIGRNAGMEVLLSPSSIALEEVFVRPQRQRYSRRENPAVELIRKVIENKAENRIESKDMYQVETYEKLSLALDNFNPNLEKGIFKRFAFVKNYMDTSEFDGRPILTVSVRENLSDVYYRKSPQSTKTFVKGRRMQGIEESIDEGGITSNLEEIFQSVNVFDNNIRILLNRFVSPLSSALGVSYYQYYIMDTVDVSGDQCVDLAFVPVNSQSYGFTGRLYITLDGKYSLKKVLLNVPRNINLNFVDQLRIEQEFKRMPDSTWVIDNENTYVSFYVVDGTQQLYAHQLRTYDKYAFEVSNPDAIFGQLGSLHILPEATAQVDTFWVQNRHVPLKEKENALGDLLNELRKVPAFNVIIKTAEILISGYIQTGRDRNSSVFDVGPMNTTFSSNEVEGFRMRVGGMTTANLHPQLFASGYMAYGMADRKFKYNTKLTYSFDKKQYHEGENPVNNLSFIQEYDLYTPGQEFLFTSKDNMFVAWKVGAPITKMNYVRKFMVQYEKEWLNGLTWTSWIKNQNNEAAGTLSFILRDEIGSLLRLDDITTSEIATQIRFAPGERAYSGRAGKGSVFNMSRDAPIFRLTHQLGLKDVLGGDYAYNRTEASAEKRIWLSSFGHIDTQLKAGKVWDKVPFPLLIMPNTNQSITIQPEAFHMMNAMEFFADQYVSLSATYYLKGWILNRIPVLNWLKLREVVSFNGIYGSLSDKNNPIMSNNLFLFPDDTQPIGSVPYMEASFGLENIFRILRVDYYRRITYLDHPNIKKHGFRIALRFAF